MIILAHRGFWTSADEKNTHIAFDRAFSNGFGIETDVRDVAGTLVISHNPPLGKCPLFADVLDSYVRHGKPGRIAINIKADGLAGQIADMLETRAITQNCFVFDMSVPDVPAYIDSPIPTFTRYSEQEEQPSWLDRCNGVWVDGFEIPIPNEKKALAFLQMGKMISMVSPELHGMAHEDAWKLWRKTLAPAAMTVPDSVMLCTDKPREAKAFLVD